MRWARYTATPPEGAPSHWVTACEQSLTTDEQAPCIGVALTLDDRLKDGTPTVLSDVPVGTNSAPELVRCQLFGDRATAEPDKADRWNWKRDRCKVMARTLSFTLRPPASANPPVTTPSDPPASECGTTDVSCHITKGIKDAIAGGVRTGIQGLTDVAVQSMAWGLGELAKWIFDESGPSTPDESFFFVYNNAAGLLLVFVLVLFIISVIINGLRVRGPTPLASLGGLVRALLGITFAGGLAFVITQAWDEATAALIDRNSVTTWNPAQWVQAVTALSGGVGTTLVALIISLFSLIGLLLVGIMLLFRGLLATGAALYGAMAMAGQVSEETQHWGRRWFWTVNALASSKFFMAMLWIYGTRGAYQSDLFTALKAMLIIWMMVMAPWVLLRLTSIFDGYVSDINARGVLAAAASGIGSAVGQAAHPGGGGGGGQGGPGDQAAGLMNTNVADMATSPARQAGQEAGQATGLTPGAQQQAADAVSTGGDQGKVGDPSSAGGPADGSTDSSGGSGEGGGQSTANGPADRPNAAEADGTQGGVQHARHDLGTGQVTAPGDATGAAGAPATDPTGMQNPGGSATDGGTATGADGAQPGGQSASGEHGSGEHGSGEHGSGAETGPGSGAPGAEPGPPNGTGSDASGSTSNDGGGAAPSGAGPPSGSTPGPSDGADGPPAGGSGPPSSSGGGGGGGGGGSGGSPAGGAAAGAADVPIVPV
ncbi:hypothetical protein AB0M46_13725 [Dactylosporangium sp. NPDC051485]|uniref:hypothetical protein n=1 Tax=Dactylosporangium sp. NPDC051485 TaxID=3154846 RepID=UPI003433FDD5